MIFLLLLNFNFVDATRFVFANQLIVYGQTTATTASSSHDCAYQTAATDGIGFSWDGSSQCQIYSTITGYVIRTDGNQYYLKTDATSCLSLGASIDAVHDLVYNDNRCPALYTYNSSSLVCQATMSRTQCNQYNALWAYPYFASTCTVCTKSVSSPRSCQTILPTLISISPVNTTILTTYLNTYSNCLNFTEKTNFNPYMRRIQTIIYNPTGDTNYNTVAKKLQNVAQTFSSSTSNVARKQMLYATWISPCTETVGYFVNCVNSMYGTTYS
ncbi:hypothetical protein M3Y95_01050700 [Aphelenchoides besseyi]|nr:hypothetical protein M3Y95_01050700 [Aphelenchoides besseyi]